MKKLKVLPIIGMIIVLASFFAVPASARPGVCITTNYEDLKHNVIYLQNDKIKFGVDLNNGGAGVWLSKAGSSQNLLNLHDDGRFYTPSYYGSPIYNEAASLCWNPLPGQAIAQEYYTDGKMIYVRTKGVDYCNEKAETDTYYDIWYTLDGDKVCCRSLFTSDDRRRDQNNGGEYSKIVFGQELNAVFFNSYFSNICMYDGDKPYTGGAINRKPTTYNNTSEGWVAAVDKNDWGVGIYSPVLFAQRSINTHETDPTKPNETNLPGANGYYSVYEYGRTYIGPVAYFNAGPNAKNYNESYLFVDTLDAIRKSANSLKQVTNSVWNFNVDGYREGWSFANTSDSNNPSGGVWEFTPRSDGSMVFSPASAIDGDKNKLIKIRLKNNTSASQIRLYYVPATKSCASPNNMGGASYLVPKDTYVDFAIKPHSDFTEYTIDMSKQANYKGLINYLNFYIVGDDTGKMAIDSIKVVDGKSSSVALKTASATSYGTKTTATVKIQTQGNASAIVEYGTSKSYGEFSYESSALKNNHTIELSNLKPGTTYNYRVRLIASDGKEVLSKNMTFKAGTGSGGTNTSKASNTTKTAGKTASGSVTSDSNTSTSSSSEATISESTSSDSVSSDTLSTEVSNNEKPQNGSAARVVLFIVLGVVVLGAAGFVTVFLLRRSKKI